MILGRLNIRDFLKRVNGEVRGTHLAEAKHRHYAADYAWREDPSRDDCILVSRTDGTGNEVQVPATLEIDESLIAFFGLYSGDGAKGSEDQSNPGRIKPPISFSQREPNLVNFAVAEFRYIFPGSIRFVFSLGEDSAFFMADEGHRLLKEYYRGDIPDVPPLSTVRPTLNDADMAYLEEIRRYQSSAEDDLAFYYYHQSAMEEVLIGRKQQEIESVGTELREDDRVTASLRRPYKKGAREAGGSSRSDETHVGGVTGLGELFLKMIHEVEESIVYDLQTSTQGLVEWDDIPSRIGQDVQIKSFFENHPYGSIGGERPKFVEESRQRLIGKWHRGAKVELAPHLRIDPLWCYAAGLYLAEGTSTKAKFFSMFRKRPTGLGLGFTSSENTSMYIILRALRKLFSHQNCLRGWKIKVGSQYFPELVMVGLKNAVPMLRGGKSGDGKLRTMEISLDIKDWGLGVVPALTPYADRYSHVEPTGAGVPRVDFWGSASLCKWYFPLLMYATFGNIITNPQTEFTS